MTAFDLLAAAARAEIVAAEVGGQCQQFVAGDGLLRRVADKVRVGHGVGIDDGVDRVVEFLHHVFVHSQ